MTKTYTFRNSSLNQVREFLNIFEKSTTKFFNTYTKFTCEYEITKDNNEYLLNINISNE